MLGAGTVFLGDGSFFFLSVLSDVSFFFSAGFGEGFGVPLFSGFFSVFFSGVGAGEGMEEPAFPRPPRPPRPPLPPLPPPGKEVGPFTPRIGEGDGDEVSDGLCE